MTRLVAVSLWYPRYDSNVRPYGLGNCSPKNASPVTQKTYDSSSLAHVPIHVLAAINNNPELTHIVTVWQELPEYIKEAIMALVNGNTNRK